jgi:hypothetical protein
LLGQVLWLAKILAGKKYRYLLIISLVGQNSRAVGKQSAFGWPAFLAKQSKQKITHWAATIATSRSAPSHLS